MAYLIEPNANPSEMRIRPSRQKPMPSREELLARNSFSGPDSNRHLDRMLAQVARKGGE